MNPTPTPETDDLANKVLFSGPALEHARKLERELNDALIREDSMRKIVHNVCHEQLPKLERERDEAREVIKTAQAVPAKDASSAASVKKDSTNELPLLDIGEAINFVSIIHEKGLENAQMPDVATQTGHKHPSSTPFYRRCVAARLFGMLAKSGPELTERARSYLKPDNDVARVATLHDAIMGLQLYADEVNKHIGKRINKQYVANSFQKVLPLTDGCAGECATVFERSLKFAGFISSDGIVTIPGSESLPPPAAPKKNGDIVIEDEEGMQTHTLYLDKTKSKKFAVSAPLDLTPTEIKRIQKWLEVTLLVDWNEPPEPQP